MSYRFQLLLALFLGLMCSIPAPRLSAQDDDAAPAASTQKDKSADAARAAEESSSKDTRIDLSPPANDQKKHPLSSTTVDDDNAASDVDEFQPWDPHKAAKDVEVGDFYFRRKNYKAAIARYKDALVYKSNDAVAEYRLAEALDKSGNPGEAVDHYKAYLKILPHGSEAKDAQKAIERIQAEDSKFNSAAR
jgi:tetratricopeptide (TPR) repeat protein